MKKNFIEGFSLIELSIVLIIIGLLVAGVTGGASLIKSAGIRSMISEFRNFDTAINAYYLSEGNLPGDSTIGNNNGRIEYVNSSDINEGIQAWKDMSDKDLVSLTASNSKIKFSFINSAFAMTCSTDENGNE